MTPRQRVLAAVHGQPTDRVPYAVWYHFNLSPPVGPWSDMADREIAFYERYRPDFLKVMHDVSYEPIAPVEQPGDWTKLSVLDPHTGNFGDQLFTLRQIRAGIGPDVPMIDTVFGVYHYAEKLSEGRLRDHLKSDPHAVHVGLRALCQSLAHYAQACVDAGCDGIYYALSGASAEGAGEEYLRHFLPYDREVLGALRSAEFNVLHLHGYKDLSFDIARELPASAVCWSDRAAGPSLAQARQLDSRCCLIGGLDETRFAQMTAAEIAEQASDAIGQAGGRSFILAPGCAIPTDTNPALIDCIGAAVGCKPQRETS